jgi:chitooligosaccharide deacetylase
MIFPVSGSRLLAAWLATALALPASAEVVPAELAARGAAGAIGAAEPVPELPVVGPADRVEGTEAPGLVAFTFDDGPSPYTTPIILRALAKHRVPATFFVVNRHLHGKRGARGLPLLARIVADGHLIGSHTANHARLRAPSEQALTREIDNAVELLERALERKIELFRPPYGVLGARAAARVDELGLTDVRWSIDPKDFHGAEPKALVADVLASVADERGGIVLLLDTKRNTAQALDDLLAGLRRMNCRRLSRGEQPILPVSLHYFLRDNGAPRAVPAEVQARTAAYRAYLQEQCAARAGADADDSPERERLDEQADEPKATERKKRRRHRRDRARKAPAEAAAGATLQDL